MIIHVREVIAVLERSSPTSRGWLLCSGGRRQVREIVNTFGRSPPSVVSRCRVWEAIIAVGRSSPRLEARHRVWEGFAILERSLSIYEIAAAFGRSPPS